MKHQHEVKVEVVDISTDIETVIDKVTESAIIIIAASAVAHILKSFFKNNPN